ncbi:hypothetical protein EDB83DRAFT_28132 [Lactarius deliciosus]|nr:hypothetical protein EDB83DRAFT_28132 [Lactarius deliciosus]
MSSLSPRSMWFHATATVSLFCQSCDYMSIWHSIQFSHQHTYTGSLAGAVLIFGPHVCFNFILTQSACTNTPSPAGRHAMLSGRVVAKNSDCNPKLRRLHPVSPSTIANTLIQRQQFPRQSLEQSLSIRPAFSIYSMQNLDTFLRWR